eukprot:CAMPEP_0185303718 /NCGR_PEP_ID=MMETSP1363-20130426/14270_1 /TAXON_ID=38817 /ORGANISM="Gephyrocapsa oceanica, Strain RCC1303" /LENGTH=98 /DNA_ID=CAMNT_0027900875 /DNA_START=17 /DNA_END=314 /DNA_ORIENTATION=-
MTLRLSIDGSHYQVWPLSSPDPESSTLTLDVSHFMPARGTAAASIGSRAMEHMRLAWQSTLKPVLESVGAEASIDEIIIDEATVLTLVGAAAESLRMS